MKTFSEITVRYAETDQMGIAHHSVYAVWYEVGRTEYVKQFGISYTEMEKAGVMMPLTSLECHFILPAKYEDEIIIETIPYKVSQARMSFEYTAVRKKDKVKIGWGRTEHGFVDSVTHRPVSVKKRLPDLFEQISNDALVKK